MLAAIASTPRDNTRGVSFWYTVTRVTDGRLVEQTERKSTMPVISKKNSKSRRLTPLTDEQRELVEQNFKLVFHVIRLHSHRWPHLSSDDMLSECMYGLLKASRNFDESLGYQFSTFACNCMLRHTTSINSRVRLDVMSTAMSLSVHKDGFDFDIYGEIDDSSTMEHDENVDYMLGLVSGSDRDVVYRHLLKGEQYHNIGENIGRHKASVRHKYRKAIERIGAALREKRLMEVSK